MAGVLLERVEGGEDAVEESKFSLIKKNSLCRPLGDGVAASHPVPCRCWDLPSELAD
jgi:hypothetical protein